MGIVISGHRELAMAILQSHGFSESDSDLFIADQIKRHCENVCAGKGAVHVITCGLCMADRDSPLTRVDVINTFESLFKSKKCVPCKK